MTHALQEAACARVPASQLGRLGVLRAREEVRAVVEGERVWVFWPAPDVELAAWMLSLPGADLLRRGPHGWQALKGHLPIFDVPDPETGRRLSSLLFPAPVEAVPPGQAEWRPVEVRLVADDLPRPTTALLLPLSLFARWAEEATSRALSSITAARHGDRLLLRGRLPALDGERYWGGRVLVPAGRRPEPLLAEAVLAQALHLGDDEVALLTAEGAEILPAGAFGPVTRAGVRLALEGAAHAR
jgi:hypothetical protein